MDLMLRLAWRNLWRQPRRTWLTAGAMVFSNILLVFMVSMQFGMYDLMIENTLALYTGHMQVQAPGYKEEQKIRQVVPDASGLAASLRDELGLQTVAARASAFALVSSAERSFGIKIVGVQPDFEAGVSSVPGLVKQGRYLAPGDTDAVVIGSVLARNLRVAVGDELTLLGSGYDGSFAAAVATVVGIFESGVPDLDRSLAEMPLGYFQDVFYMDGAGHEVVVVTPSLGAVDGVYAQLKGLLPADEALVALDWDTLEPGLRQAIMADLTSGWFIYSVLVVLVAFSVLNTVLMSVLERTREFGIALSLGLTPGRLAGLVMLETALLGLLGLALGVLLGGALAAWVGEVGFTYPGLEEMAQRFNVPGRIYPEPTFVSVLAGPAIVYLGTLLAAIYPALRLHWLQPVDAMRAA